MVSRLPTPGSDNGQWGQILNDYLSVEHNSDGTLKKAADIVSARTDASQALANAQTAQTTADSKYAKPANGIPAGDLTAATQASLVKADSSVQSVNAVFPSSGNVTLTASDVSAIPTSQKGAANGVASLDATSKIPSTQLDASSLPDGVVTLPKLSPSLKPSGTATATDESLRALGTTAGTAAAGNDVRITGSIQATDLASPSSAISKAIVAGGGVRATDGRLRQTVNVVNTFRANSYSFPPRVCEREFGRQRLIIRNISPVTMQVGNRPITDGIATTVTNWVDLPAGQELVSDYDGRAWSVRPKTSTDLDYNIEVEREVEI